MYVNILLKLFLIIHRIFTIKKEKRRIVNSVHVREAGKFLPQVLGSVLSILQIWALSKLHTCTARSPKNSNCIDMKYELNSCWWSFRDLVNQHATLPNTVLELSPRITMSPHFKEIFYLTLFLLFQKILGQKHGRNNGLSILSYQFVRNKEY